MKFTEIFRNPEGRVRAIWRAILYVPAYLIVVFPLNSFAITLASSLGLGDTFEHTLFLFGLTGALAALTAAALLLAGLDRRRFGTLGLWFYRGWWKELALGVALGFLLLSVVVGVEAVTGAARFHWASTASQSLRGLAWCFVVILPAAVKEELLLRGYAFQRLIESLGPWPAAAGLSVLFGLLHLWNPSRTLLSTTNTILIGILLAVGYLKTRALWLPVGLHFGWNFFLGYVYSLPVSGLVLDCRLLAAEVSGPIYLTGGKYGPEGSLISTVVIMVATVGLWRTKKISVSEEMTQILK